ncbi:MAG: hypothetical protein LBN38_08190 [Verrucomicrobiota bacterium]|nr:hypothetical protein [Verrucomicrobiota bacterium]
MPHDRLADMSMNVRLSYGLLATLGLVLLVVEWFIPVDVVGGIGILCILVAMGRGLFCLSSGILLCILGIQIGVGWGLLALPEPWNPLFLPAPWPHLFSVGVLLFYGAALLLLVRGLPRSRAKKRIILSTTDASYASILPPSTDLVGRSGEAWSALRPGGIAVIEGKRYDVLADGGEWIAAGEPLRVHHIHNGNLVVVSTQNDV